jgi:hypothetical protein
MHMTTTKTQYTPISEDKVPAGVRFDCPRRLQGQTIEREFGGFSRSEHDDGDLYMRVTDRTTGSVQYFVRA